MSSLKIEQISVGDLISNRFQCEVNTKNDIAAIPDSFIRIVSSNPLAKDSDPAAFILRYKGVAAARIHVFPVECRLSETTVRFYWGMSFLTAPEFRSSGTGYFLIREVTERIRAQGDFFGVYAMSDEAARIYRALGFHDLGRSPRYLWVLNSRPVLTGHMPQVMVQLARPAVNIGLAVGGMFLHRSLRRSMSSCVFEARNEFDEEVDQLVTSPPSEAMNWFPVNHRLLNWRLLAARSNPRKHLGVFYIRMQEEGTLAGYIVTRSVHKDSVEGHPYQNFRILSLVDYWVRDCSETLHSAIVGQVIQEGKKQGMDVVEVVTNSRYLLQSLRAAHLKRLGGFDCTYIAPENYNGPLPKQIEDWRLTMATGDGFLF